MELFRYVISQLHTSLGAKAVRLGFCDGLLGGIFCLCAVSAPCFLTPCKNWILKQYKCLYPQAREQSYKAANPQIHGCCRPVKFVLILRQKAGYSLLKDHCDHLLYQDQPSIFCRSLLISLPIFYFSKKKTFFS
jgi:hypothetical protein